MTASKHRAPLVHRLAQRLTEGWDPGPVELRSAVGVEAIDLDPGKRVRYEMSMIAGAVTIYRLMFMPHPSWSSAATDRPLVWETPGGVVADVVAWSSQGTPISSGSQGVVDAALCELSDMERFVGVRVLCIDGPVRSRFVAARGDSLPLVETDWWTGPTVMDRAVLARVAAGSEAS